ncbi:MAG: alpha/beta fold hydrolase [Streptosporangiaceae bacterium]
MGGWGFSGGGSYALASAALLPDLVTGAAVFASFAPYGSPGLDFCDGMSPESAGEVELFFTDRSAARQHWRQDADRLFAALSTPDDWTAILTPWGCDLTTTRVPVRLWHGARDLAVPVVHGRWLATHVPGIVAHISESEDHANTEHNHKETAYAWLSQLT